MSEPNVPEETVAVGDLFKLGGSQGGRKTWNLRRFYLSGIYLSYFNRGGKKKGQWDIRDCVVRKTTPEECQMPDALYAFALVGKNKFFVMCASNEKSRAVWIRCIDEQIEEFKYDLRQHLLRGEIVIADEKVKKKGGMLGLFSPVRLVVTNFPKVMIVELKDCVRKEQMSWGKNDPPRFTTVNEKRFKIAIGHKEIVCDDEDKGSVFWETLFRRFPDVELYVAQHQETTNVDFEAVYNNETERAEELADEQDQVASMEMGDLELSANNLSMLESALGNVRELVTAISSKIVAIEEEIDWELEARDPVFAAAAAADRAQRKIQLQILKDNVAVISANLEALVAKSVEVGIINIDMNPVENVLSETSAMLTMLTFEDERPPAPVAPLPTPPTQSGKVKPPPPKRPYDENGEAIDVVITEDNFDASDIRKRPENWNEIRLKRVLVLEVFDMMSGVDFDTIIATRKGKVAQVEAEMVQEILQYGSLQNGELIKGLNSTDCSFLLSNSVDLEFLQQYVDKKALEKVVKASVQITAENFVEDDLSVRPMGWNLVKNRRVTIKKESVAEYVNEDIANLLNSEEVIMCSEVKKYGQVQFNDVVETISTSLQTAAVADAAKQEEEFGSVKDLHSAKSGPTSGDNNRDSEIRTRDRKSSIAKSMNLTSFIDAANKTLEELSEQVAGSLTLEDSGHSRNKNVSKDMHNSMLSFVPKTNLQINLKEAKGGLKKVVMKDDLKQLNINAENFDVNNPKKRPQGWEQVRLRRVLKQEEDDRNRGMVESQIAARRGVRLAQEEQAMLEEVTVGGRIRMLNMKKSAPVFPKAFQAAMATSKTNATGTNKPGAAAGAGAAKSNFSERSFVINTAATTYQSSTLAVKGNPLVGSSSVSGQRISRRSGQSAKSPQPPSNLRGGRESENSQISDSDI